MQLRSKILLLLLMLLGFAARVYDLEGQFMGSDEGLSLYRALAGGGRPLFARGGSSGG